MKRVCREMIAMFREVRLKGARGRWERATMLPGLKAWRRWAGRDLSRKGGEVWNSLAARRVAGRVQAIARLQEGREHCKLRAIVGSWGTWRALGQISQRVRALDSLRTSQVWRAMVNRVPGLGRKSKGC